MKRLVLLIVLLVTGCSSGTQSITNAAGLQAGRIEQLWWFLFWLLGAIFACVITMLLLALLRSKRGEPHASALLSAEPTEHKMTTIVTAASVATVGILLGLIAVSVATGKSVASLGDTTNGLVIEVTANQWWWYIRYQNDKASETVVTANEIHIPVGRPVMIRGTSNDVIHSFWVPNLHGKRDLIPSRVTTEWIQADRPGRYRGQCAEFCGLQHAHMAFWVVAESPSEFQAWMNHQLQPAAEPTDTARQRGKEIFLKSACVYCHTIAGTGAAGQTGPDLTHFGSRLTIAAGTLPNNKGNLGGWIADPQNIKPGNRMATVPLASDEMNPLLDYLESLR